MLQATSHQFHLHENIFDKTHILNRNVWVGLFSVTFVACSAQVISAYTQPMSLRTLLLLMSALQDRFLRMLETT